MDIGFLAIVWKEIKALKKQDLVQPNLDMPPGWSESGYLNDEEKRLYSIACRLRDTTGALSDKILREGRQPTEREDILLKQGCAKLDALRSVLFSSIAIRLKLFGKEVAIFRQWQVAWRDKPEASGILVLEPVDDPVPVPAGGYRN